MMRAFKLTGVVVVLLCASSIAKADEAKGTIKTVDTGRNEVVLKGVVKDTIYELEKDCAIWLDGLKAKLGDLSADDKVVIIYEKRGDHLMANSVRGLRKAQETSGTVNEIVGEKREVVIKGTVKNTTYELVKGGTVWVDGKMGSLKDISAGDTVRITYETRGDHYMANDVVVFRKK